MAKIEGRPPPLLPRGPRWPTSAQSSPSLHRPIGHPVHEDHPGAESAGMGEHKRRVVLNVFGQLWPWPAPPIQSAPLHGSRALGHRPDATATSANGSQRMNLPPTWSDYRSKRTIRW